MSSFLPPLYYFTGIGFNNNFYDLPTTSGISSSYADSHYLKSTGTATSSATLTSFNGIVSLNSSLIQDSLVIALTGNYNITLIGGINYLSTSSTSYLLTLPSSINGIVTITNTSGYTQTLFHSSLIIGT